MSQPPIDRIQDGSAGKPEPHARRTRLREFQAQLAQRVQAAQNSAERNLNQLGVMIGDTHCLLDLQQTSEILPVRSITKVPLTLDWYLGLSSIRGNLVGVVDFPRFLGYAATELDAACRIIIFSRGLSLHGGLLVPRVLGLRNPQQMAPAPDAEPASALSRWTTQCYRDEQARLWMQIDLAALVQDPRYLQIGL
ncbi:MAG: chemotaxis protein CheW [Oxalobacteraceae bacterium]|nr:chemotaxis protein CheW [Oxalobacteraceae bacterium]